MRRRTAPSAVGLEEQLNSMNPAAATLRNGVQTVQDTYNGDYYSAGQIEGNALANGAVVLATMGAGDALGAVLGDTDTAAAATDASAGTTPPADPLTPPGPGWEWRPVTSNPASGRGSWYNPGTDESLHPDLNHPDPIPPHWDYTDPSGDRYRWFLDGRMEPR